MNQNNNIVINKYNSYNYINAILPPSVIGPATNQLASQLTNQFGNQLTQPNPNALMNNGFALYGTSTALTSSINKQLTNETPFAHQYNSPAAVPQSQYVSNPLNTYNAQTDYANGSSFASSLVSNSYSESPAKEEKPKSNHYPAIHPSNSVNSVSNVANNLVSANLHPTNQNLSCLSSSNCSNFSTSSSNSSLENSSTFHPSLHSSHYYSRQQHYARSSFNASSPRSLISNSYTSKLNQNQPIYTSASSYYHFHQQLSAQSESSSLSSSSSIDYSNPSQNVNQTQAEEDYSAAFYKQHLLMNDTKTAGDYMNPGEHHSQMTYNDYQLSNSKDNFSLNVSNCNYDFI